MLPTPNRMTQHGYGVFSPNGKQIAYWRTSVGGVKNLQLVVAPTDGSSEGRLVGPAIADATGLTLQAVVWAPDGTAIAAPIGNDQQTTTWWIPLDGTAPHSIGSGALSFVDIQRLAP